MSSADKNRKGLFNDISWRRVHPITPLAKGWSLFIIVPIIVLNGGAGVINGLIYLAKTNFFGHFSLIITGVVLLTLALVSLLLYVSWRFTGYAITEDSVLFRKGVIFKSERHIRLERIQAVDVITPLLGRIFGLSKLHVDAAGGSGSQIDIMFLRTALALDLRNEILARAAGLRVDELIAPAGQEHLTNFVTPVNPDDFSKNSLNNPAFVPIANSALEAPEHQLYTISPAMLFQSILRSLSLWAQVALLVTLLAAPFIFIVTTIQNPTYKDNYWALLTALLPQALTLLIVLWAIVSLFWSKINSFYNFTAAVSPDGIRLRHGLTEHRSQTIPPGRIHGVELSQPFLWRGPNWWKVRITMAGYHLGNLKETSKQTVLLPVGTWEQALQALWLVEKDFGKPLDLMGLERENVDAEDLILRGSQGTNQIAEFFQPTRAARIFDPLAWRRQGFTFTSTFSILRLGRITRVLVFIPHARLQSLHLHTGPLNRLAKVTNLHLDLVPGVVPTVIQHQPPNTAAQAWRTLSKLSQASRETEAPEAWMKRVTQSQGPGVQTN